MTKDFLTCRECVDLLQDYLDSNLDPETLKQLDEHFKLCPPCVHFLDTYRSYLTMGTQLRDQQVQVPHEMEDRLKSFIRDQLKAS